ncbi:putative ATP-grasp superfamily ATP-dependent carboligase [Thermocatellispora tengchongensis]|uniref:Putative ATP-grasp superfamily ATP-dependent carboligase n=1 Tax=Thermocatellispora tengchongensis TaxID=1073253 RepID=A0A840P837_9ACTN|nr:ATP-grasp domain-containing protein [Thermocatellispora tengchongensis]MBB5133377.1 putative ATP-grasp superfamily ATP-dependent carboligase [Thermocatellispora tengchongensis]
MSLDTATPALIMRLDDNVFHHGTLAAIRSLGGAGVPVHALLEGPHAPASRSRHLSRMHVWGTRERGPQAVVGELLALAARIGTRAVLVPMDDLGALLVGEHAAELSPAFLLPAQPPGVPRLLADKARLAGLCRALGLAQPETRPVTGMDDLPGALADLGLPVVAKWARPWLVPAGVRPRSTTLVHRFEHAAHLVRQSAGHGATLLLQRYVPESAGSDWFFHGYFGAGSRCLFGGAGRKERAYPAGCGLTTYGTWLPNPRLESLACGLAEAIGYRGILDLDFRHDPGTGQYHLLDANPRPGAQFRLFESGAGLDVVRALHLDLTGREVEPGAPAHGRTYLVENYDARTALLRPRPSSPRRWWRSVRHAHELAWFSRDDPAPFLAMGGQSLKRAFTRLRRGR